MRWGHWPTRKSSLFDREENCVHSSKRKTVPFTRIHRGLSFLQEKEAGNEAGCSQEEGPKKGFVMGSRTQGVQEILEKCM